MEEFEIQDKLILNFEFAQRRIGVTEFVAPRHQWDITHSHSLHRKSMKMNPFDAQRQEDDGIRFHGGEEFAFGHLPLHRVEGGQDDRLELIRSLDPKVSAAP